MFEILNIRIDITLLKLVRAFFFFFRLATAGGMVVHSHQVHKIDIYR